MNFMDPIKNRISDESMLGLLSAIEEFRKLEREMPAQLLSVLLYVATHDPCHKQAIEQDLDFSTASCSRNLNWLSAWHRIENRPGLNFIEQYKDPSNRRRLINTLTPKGRDFINSVKTMLYGQ